MLIWGSPDEESTWAELDALLRTKWRHPFGGQIGIDATAVDSGAWTDKVYGFSFPRLNRRIWPVKGIAGHHVAFAHSRGKVKGGRLFLVGVDTIKTTIINRFTRGQSIRFAGHLGDEYFAQLASERKVVRYSRGQPLVRFERKVGARAEALDCLVYAWAARAGAQIQFDRRESELQQKPVALPPAAREPSWFGKELRF